ncbi:MAG: CocE/NonD family hydrolase [Bacteroidetes bacterium]|nr:CocE/NonD family hydrolase [Bacteroidota bacterium]
MRIIIALIVSFILLSCSGKDKPDPRKTEVKIKMSDGTELATDIFLPRGNGKYPVVLVRTPYGKWQDAWMSKAFRFFRIAVVLQDVRGKNGSGGEFYPFKNERSDGLQTLRWIRQQPWSNGNITGWGGSYVGYTQWAISDSLDFLTPLLTGANIYDFVYPDSLFSLHSAFLWGVVNASSTANTMPPEKLKSGPLTLPVSAADDSTIKDVQFLNDWIAHEKYDEYWKRMNVRGITKSPVISTAGWYDIFLLAQIRDFQALVSDGRKGSRLIIGPWCHGSMGEPNEFGGLKKTGKPTKLFRYVKNQIKGRKPKLSSPFHDNTYNLFIMERNEYIGSEVYPPEQTTIVPLYLGPDGRMSFEKIEENGVLTYKYDPADPYPSLGGTILGDKVGPARQNDNASRKDQLVFEMAVNEKTMTLLGPVSATLWLQSDVASTDFVVGLQDVFPDGKIINIQEGGARVKPLSNHPQKTEISVWATGYQLNPGHKLRVFISSSWFPRYNRNLNNGEAAATATKISTAEQKVYYGGDTPSSINLPIFED